MKTNLITLRRFKTFARLLLCFPFLAANAQLSTQALHVLEENSTVILEAGKLFNISPRLIASVIYVEHALNVTWVDRDVDPLLAGYGLNVSLGLGQVKINTAMWIEKSLSDSTSNYFLKIPLGLGASFSAKGGCTSGANPFLRCDSSRAEIVKRLLTPNWNAQYIAADLAMVRYRWKKVGVNIDNRIDILATLYSAGVVTDNAPWTEKRPPHSNAQANSFGKLAKEFYESELLLTLFPK